METWIIIVVIIILIICICHIWRMRTHQEREFMSGFWCASPDDCATKGYRGAYLYIDSPTVGWSPYRPLNDIGASRAYIVALKGGTGQINRPFDFDVQKSPFSGVTCGRMCLDGYNCDVVINLDFINGRMIWRDKHGVPLFTWEKNARVTSEILNNPAIV